jgi:pimeloyl-ACP methyl ester carboxylesterase
MGSVFSTDYVTMIDIPEVRYASTTDGLHIAYQVVATGDRDVVFIPSWFSSIDLCWETPSISRFLRRLASFSRLILFDKRGVAASDPLSAGELPTIEEWAEDIGVVMDDAGSDRAVLFGVDDGGLMAILFAASHPERVSALILFETTARFTQTDDYRLGLAADVRVRRQHFLGGWGAKRDRQSFFDLTAPSSTETERGDRGKWERRVASPATAASVYRMLGNVDVRAVLPSLRVPTLVLHRSGDRWLPPENGRYLAQAIPGARFVELEGSDHFLEFGDQDDLLDEVEEFLTGSHQGPEGDVVTATILFTDIVASTEQAARMGHRKWTRLTDAHDAMVRAILQRHRGREVKTIGDGFLATFDATTRAVRAAMEIAAGATGLGLDVRAGVHTGEVEVRPSDVVGLTVSIANRICDLAGPGEVFVSETVKGLIVGSGIAITEQGTHVLKGLPEEWPLFAAGI